MESIKEKAVSLWQLYIIDWLKQFRDFLPNDVSLEQKEGNTNETNYVMAEIEYMTKRPEGLSMSFFVNDLNMVASEMQRNEAYFTKGVGKILYEFIVSPTINTKERFDIVSPESKDKDTILRTLMEPKYYPKGKWISKYSPALMQQVAINMASFDADMEKQNGTYWGINGPLFSVNGPPGTGKTTLLKEIIVNNIVQRASLLSEYNSPDEAFEEFLSNNGNVRLGNHCKKPKVAWRYFSFKNKNINKYGILVTSSNNAAVENITKELPDFKQLGDAQIELKPILGVEQNKEFSTNLYFTPEAKTLLTKIQKSKQTKQASAWALISAPLGKSDNIKIFCESVLAPLCEKLKNGSLAEEIDFLACKNEFLTQERKVSVLQQNLEKQYTQAMQSISPAKEIYFSSNSLRRIYDSVKNSILGKKK